MSDSTNSTTQAFEATQKAIDAINKYNLICEAYNNSSPRRAEECNVFRRMKNLTT